METQHTTLTPQQQQNIVDYYETAGPDYAVWSKQFNMHYGLALRLTDLFHRERMLENMNQSVLDRLKLDASAENKIADLGCGMGAVTRYAASRYPNSDFYGVSLVPYQIKTANKLTDSALKNTQFLCEDFTKLPFQNDAIDAAFALESACHGKGSEKRDFIKELSRVLKPGGRFVIADGFMKNPLKPLKGLAKRSYQQICKCWALPEFAQIEYFKACLEEHGLVNIKIEDVSWRVAPSVLHSPFLVLGFYLKSLLKREPLKEWQKNNLKGVLSAIVLGLKRSKFGYYIISGEKAG